MEVTFKFAVGQRVTIIEAKIECVIVAATIDVDGSKSYNVQYWHDGGKLILPVAEWEIK